MDIIMYKKAIEYVGKLYEDAESLHKLGIAENKPACLQSPIRYPFKRALPETVGIDSARLTAFLQELLAEKELHPHLLMVMKDDKIILDYAHFPYRSEVWHVSHSLCKSITALAVGLAIEDGALSLDDKLWDIFKKRPFSLDFARQNDITVRHLLMMSAGVTFNELGSVTYEDYMEGFFTASVKFTPGTKFLYNSMNSYMLSAAIKERTGRDMFELLKERLFDPMGITEVYFEKCPRGISKGGWGMYMRIEDTLKFGKLFLDGGLWQGKRLISAEWLSEISKKQIDSSPAMCDYGYGYHLWRSIRRGSYQFNGMLGQNLIIFPDIRMVIAFHAGNTEFFPKSKFVSLVGKYFGDSFTPSTPRRPSLPKRFAYAKALRAVAPPPVSPFKRSPHRDFLCSINGKAFSAEPKKLSLLPLAVSVMQSNFDCLVKSLRFETGKQNAILFTTNGGIARVPFDVDGRAKYFPLSLGGDHFSVASLAEVTASQSGKPVLHLTLHYLEQTSVREFYFVFGEKTAVRSMETPNGKALLDGFSPLLDEQMQDNKLLKLLSDKADSRIEQKMKPLFEIDSLLTELPR